MKEEVIMQTETTNTELVNKEYGVTEFVPPEDRHMSGWDMAATLAGAQCNPTSWWTGGVIAASGIVGAIVSTSLSSPIIFGIMALIGLMGYKVSTTSMGLTRVPFGIRGSVLPSIANIVLNIGWNGLGCYLAAISMSYLFGELFGWPVYGDPNSEWVLIIGASINVVLSTAIVLIGGSRGIKMVEKFIVVIMVGLSIWITVAVASTIPLEQLLAWTPGDDYAISTGAAMDIITANIFCWVICVAEFSRYAKSKSAASVSPMAGSVLAFYFFAFTGAIGVIGASITTGVFDPNYSDPSSVAVTLGLGWVALLVVVMAVVTTNVTGLYVAVLATANIKETISTKKVTIFLGLCMEVLSIATIYNATIYDAFSMWLAFLGIVIPPLAAIMVTDYYCIRKGNYITAKLDDAKGPYWYKNGFNPWGFVSWILGSCCAYYLQSIAFGSSLIGSVVPGFLATCVIYFIIAKCTGAGKQS